MIGCPDPGADHICQNLNKKTDAHGFTHKVNLNWQVDDDKMLYFTWSTGFPAPASVNRNALVTDQPYQPDFLTQL